MRVRELGERKKRARGRLRLEGAAGTVGGQLYAVLLERSLQAEAQRVADKRGMDRDAAGGDAFLGNQAVESPGRPAQHLPVEAKRVGQANGLPP